MLFAAEFALICRVSASMLTSEGGRHASGINARPIPSDLVVLAESAQDRFVDTLPNARLHPLVKATPSCHAATATKLTRQIFPRYPGPEDEHNSRQGCPVIDARPPAFGGSTVIGKMSCCKRPEVFREKCLGHGISPAANRAAILMPVLWL